jgi:hypothetical protein
VAAAAEQDSKRGGMIEPLAVHALIVVGQEVVAGWNCSHSQSETL